MVITLHCSLPDQIPVDEVGWNIDLKREDELLERFIRNNWTLTDPAADSIGFGYTIQQIDRAKSAGKNITLHCYNVPGASRMVFADTAAQVFNFEVKVRIDIGLRDIRASSGGAGVTPIPGFTGAAKRPQSLTNIDKFLQGLITINSRGLQNNGVNEISVFGYPEYIVEPIEGGNDVILYHYVLTVLFHYWKVISGDAETPTPVDTTSSTSINKFSTPLALKYVTDLSLLDSDPDPQFIFMFVKQVDTNNDGLFLRMRKNGAFVDLQVA